MTIQYDCPDCGSDKTRLTTRAVETDGNWPKGTQLMRCADCGHRWANA